jgi:cyclopropane fatty-acyl-phospholipid synthase-like methyltransferase
MLLELGSYHVSDFLPLDSKYKNRKKYELNLELDSEIGAARLTQPAPSHTMWGKYWYRSGINTSMTNELKNIVTEISSRIKYQKGDIWLDIACNDGTMFKFIPNEFTKLGIDPCDDSYYQESCKVADVIIQDYFNKENYIKTGYGDKKCKVITTIAMFYDLKDPNPFIQDVVDILDDDGLWVLQMSYTPLMIEQLAFDNICHEHVYYYSLNSIQKLFKKHNLKIVDCSLNDTNGGSFRIYVQKDIAKKDSFSTSPLRSVCDFRIKSIFDEL